MSKAAQRLPHRVHWPHRWVVWLVVGLVVAAGIAFGVHRAFLAGPQTRSEFLQGCIRRGGDRPESACARCDRVCVRAARHLGWFGWGRGHEDHEPMASGCADADREQQQDLARRGGPPARPGGRRWTSRTPSSAGSLGCSESTARDHDSRADVGLERADRRQRRLRLAERGRRLSRACRRPETAGPAARDRRPDTSESGGRGVAALVHPACRLAAPGRPARDHLPPLQHRLEHRRPGRRQGLRQAAPAALPRTHLPAAPPTSAPPTTRKGRSPEPARTAMPVPPSGTLTDTTAWHLGKGADGAIVTDAKDEARFLTALTNGTLLDPNILGELGAGDPSGCSGPRPYRQRRRQRLQDGRRLRRRRQPGRRAPPQRREARRDRVRPRRGRGKQPLLRRLTVSVEPRRRRRRSPRLTRCPSPATL